jgi:hypothetical protein
VVQAINDGLYSPALKSRMAGLEAERRTLPFSWKPPRLPR